MSAHRLKCVGELVMGSFSVSLELTVPEFLQGLRGEDTNGVTAGLRHSAGIARPDLLHQQQHLPALTWWEIAVVVFVCGYLRILSLSGFAELRSAEGF